MRRASMLFLAALTAVACTGADPSGTFSEVSIDTAATSSPERPLLGGGTSFGECGGYCRSEIVIRSDGRVVLGLSRWGDHPHPIRNRGTLASDALEMARSIAADLEGTTLKDVYGCPDRTDRGAAWAKTWSDDQPVVTTYEYGGPPPPLTRADHLIGELIDALSACETTSTATIQPGCTLPPSY